MTPELAFALLATLIGLLVVVLVIRKFIGYLRAERAAQPPETRSRLWVVILAGVGAYLAAYFAFGGNLLAPLRLALIASAIGSLEVVRRWLR